MYRYRLLSWFVISILPSALESFIQFGVNLKSCHVEKKDVPRNSMVRCSNFKEYALCVDSRTRCNFVPDCPYDTQATNVIVSDEANCAETFCNFENNTTCGWNLTSANYTGDNNITSTWKWRIRKAVVGSSGVPSSDHTLRTDGAGHYLLAEMHEARPGDRAVFLTPIIGSSEENCTLEYYYFFENATPGSLNVLQTHKRFSASGDDYELFTKTLDSVQANEPGKWIKRSISWTKNEFYTISFVVTVPASVDVARLLGSIAVDDIRFINCAKVDNSTPMPDPFGPICPDEMFNCMETSDELNCVPQVVICDTVQDCPSGLDESSCSCDDYPFDFCPSGECILDNETLKPVCMCTNGTTGTGCTNQSSRSEQSHLFSLTVIIISAGAAVSVFVFVAYILFRVACQRRGWGDGRVSIEQGYDVTFVLDTAQLHMNPRRPSSSRMFRNTNVSNSDLLVLDNEWGLNE